MIAGIDRFLIGQHNAGLNPRWADRGAGCPTPYAVVLLAERFGQDPVTWPHDHDADAVLRLFAILSAEGRMKEELARVKGQRYYRDEGA